MKAWVVYHIVTSVLITSILTLICPDYIFAAPETSEIKKDIAEIKKSVVMIEIGNQLKGAGFLITNEGYILTAKHVLGSSLAASVKFFGQDLARPAHVVDVHSHFDLAYLKIRSDDLPPPLVLGDSSIIRSSDIITVIGHPQKMGDQQLFEDSSLSVKTVDNWGRIILNGYLFPGNSGGPALNNRSEVVGVTLSRGIHVKRDRLGVGQVP
jgi:S1-C subfamily serine protease